MPLEPIIDLSFLEENMMGEADFILEVIDLYRAQVPEFLEALRESLDEGDWKRMKFNAHKMRSSAATVGVAELVSVLSRLEEGTARGDPSDELARLIDRVAELGRASVVELDAARLRYVPEA